MREPNVKIITSSHTFPAGEIASIWKFRESNQQLVQKSSGLHEFASALQHSDAARQITSARAVGDTQFAELFWDADTSELVGAVVVTLSEHTRKFYRGELTGHPFDKEPSLAKEPVLAKTA